MPIETFNYLNSLVPDNPVISDGVNAGATHIRGIKLALKNTFPNVTGPINVTQDQINAIAALLVNGVLRANGAAFPGMIADHGGITAPAGWLPCDGQAVSRTTYADLYGQIGTLWGAGDGSTTFNVPNLIARYRRHRDNSTVSGGVSIKQADQNKAHYHAVAYNGMTGSADRSLDHLHTGATGSMNRNVAHSHGLDRTIIAAGQGAGGVGGGGAFGLSQNANTTFTDTNHEHAFTTNGIDRPIDHLHAISFNVNSGTGSGDGNETRPLSATVLTCIKY